MWSLHRGCASVPPCLYEKLSNSDEPFVCLACANVQLKREILLLRDDLKGVLELGDTIERQRSKIATLKTDSELHGDLIQQQQSEIAALKAELVEVKAEVKSLTVATVTVSPTLEEPTTYAAMAAGASTIDNRGGRRDWKRAYTSIVTSRNKLVTHAPLCKCSTS